MAYKEGGRPATGGLRPIPGGGPDKIIARKPPFNACGTLKTMTIECRNAGSADAFSSTACASSLFAATVAGKTRETIATGHCEDGAGAETPGGGGGRAISSIARIEGRA